MGFGCQCQIKYIVICIIPPFQSGSSKLGSNNSQGHYICIESASQCSELAFHLQGSGNTVKDYLELKYLKHLFRYAMQGLLVDFKKKRIFSPCLKYVQLLITLIALVDRRPYQYCTVTDFKIFRLFLSLLLFIIQLLFLLMLYYINLSALF